MTSLSPRQVGPDVCVSAQLDPAAMVLVAKAGFRSVVNNRPDFEGGADQPTSSAMRQAAEQAGLVYAYLPVQPAVQTEQDIARFAELLAELPKPILAYCRSGARSGRLYQQAVNLG